MARSIKLKSFLVLSFLVTICSYLKGQYSYEFLLSTSMDERAWYVYHDKFTNNQIVLITQECDDDDTNCIPRRLIYTLTDSGDTIRWPFSDHRNDTMFSINTLITEDNGDIFMAGLGWTQDSTGSLKNEFDYHLKWNNNYQVVWENINNRPQYINPFSASYNFHIIRLINGNYLIGKTIKTVDPILSIKYYLLEIDKNTGDVIKERYIEEIGGAAYLQSLTYNLDSSELILHSGPVYMAECDRNTEGAIMIDTATFDTIRTFCYNRDDDDPLKYWCVDMPYNARIHPSGTLILAGTGGCSTLTSDSDEDYIFIYQYDSAFELLNRQFLTNKDTIIDAGWFESLDINDNNEICVAGNHDRHLGPWNSHYSWIYLAKVDENLNLISERYLGGDAYYTIYSMAATSDGGIVTCGTRFDYLINDHERDAFVIKTDGQLWVGQNENSIIPVHSAIVYPNPGNNTLIVRSTEYPASFRLTDILGRIQLNEAISGRETSINTSRLKNGVYMWTISKNQNIVEQGKWIKY